MSQIKQIKTVTVWEFRRFFKVKNELISIVIMLGISSVVFLGTVYINKESEKKVELTVLEGASAELVAMLGEYFVVDILPKQKKEEYIQAMPNERSRQLLVALNGDYALYSWSKPVNFTRLQDVLTTYNQTQVMDDIGLAADELEMVMASATIDKRYIHQEGQGRRVLAYFFAGLLILAVFLSFAYQFTAITGEKQMRITEQIVSAIKPQVWMDGKILGITLTGICSMLTYSVISVLGGMLFFQFGGQAALGVLSYLHLPTITLFFAFTLMGILMWNAVLAAIASVITDPNNSAKSSFMMLPTLFVLASFLLMRDPDSILSAFLSWFPLTSASAMPMRIAVTEVPWWHVVGSFIVLTGAFWMFRWLAAKIFHVSILISGKEPTWTEVLKLARKA